jgi:hypothetical protein
LLPGHLGQQAEDRQSDEEGIRGLPGGQPEGDSKRLALRIGKALHDIEAKSAQLLERRRRKLHLGVDPDGEGDPKVPPCIDRILQQRGLADARLSVHDQDPAAALARRHEQPFQRVALALAAEKLLAHRSRDHPDPPYEQDGTGQRDWRPCSFATRRHTLRDAQPPSRRTPSACAQLHAIAWRNGAGQVAP